jgi:hypothetical protein
MGSKRCLKRQSQFDLYLIPKERIASGDSPRKNYERNLTETVNGFDDAYFFFAAPVRFFPRRCEFSETPSASAFCRTAPSVRLSSFAICDARTSCFAAERSAFTSAANQPRRFFVLLAKVASLFA